MGLSSSNGNVLEQQELNSIREAVEEYRKYTCIDFVERTNEQNYINIIRDGGCYSHVGWIYWNQPNQLSLARGCAWVSSQLFIIIYFIGIKLLLN